MNTESKSSSATTENLSETTQQTESKDGKASDGYRSQETYTRNIGEIKNLKAERQELQDKINSIESTKQAEEEKKLEEKGEHLKIIELRNKRIQELEEEANNWKGTAVEERGKNEGIYKLQAFYEKLPGKLNHKDFLKLANYENIVIDPETKEVDPQSVDEVVNGFMEKYGKHAVDTKNLGRLPGDAAGSAPVSLTPDKFKDLPLNEMRKNLKKAVNEKLKRS